MVKPLLVLSYIKFSWSMIQQGRHIFLTVVQREEGISRQLGNIVPALCASWDSLNLS